MPFAALVLMVLPALAHDPATFQQSLKQPYEGYCANPPMAQQDDILGPPSEEALQQAGLRLVGLQVVFRHGARDLSSDKACFVPMKAAFKNCSVQRLVSFASDDHDAHPVPLLRKVVDAYPAMEQNTSGSGYISRIPGCGKGVLLNEAVPQTEALAHSIKEKYFRFMRTVPTSQTTRMYSTGKERTQATLFLLHKNLFKNESAQAVFFSRPVSSDPWELNQHCPRVGHARHARHFKTDPVLVQGRFPLFAHRWREAAGTDFQANFKDCLLVAQCSRQEVLQVPKGLQPDSSLFKEALAVSLELFQEHYAGDVATHEKMRLLAAPALIELDQLLQQQAENLETGALTNASASPLALWATHDTTILAFLVALGLWDGQWPPYTDTLVLEVYKSSRTRGAFFRLLHRSTVLHLPWCKPDSLQIAGLCPVASFLPPAIRKFRNMQVYRAACSKAVSLSSQAAELQLLAAVSSWPYLYTSAAILVVSSGLSFVVGCKVQAAWQRHSARASISWEPDVAAEYKPCPSHWLMDPETLAS